MNHKYNEDQILARQEELKRPIELITKMSEGGATDEEIDELVDITLKGEISEEEYAALSETDLKKAQTRTKNDLLLYAVQYARLKLDNVFARKKLKAKNKAKKAKNKVAKASRKRNRK